MNAANFHQYKFDLKKTGDRLRKFRDQFRYTNQDLADYLGLSRTAVKGYLRGKRLPSMTSLYLLRDLFGLSSVEELIVLAS